MNIKGLVNNIAHIGTSRSDLRKTKNEADREPQQGGYGGGNTPDKRKFSDEELEEALKVLRDLPGVKENNLHFRVEKNGDRVVVFVEDSTDKVIRRIPDIELRSILKSRTQETTRGNLLNKAV